jgi:hypothetical protein
MGGDAKREEGECSKGVKIYILVGERIQYFNLHIWSICSIIGWHYICCLVLIKNAPNTRM